MDKFFSINILAVFLVLALPFSTAFPGTIQTTRHNLSVTGPGINKAATEDEICIFCHVPHGGRTDIPFLWNRANPTTTYTPYASSTLHVTPGQPTGASRQCLSCHDGTIALGGLVSRPDEVLFAGGIRFMPPGDSNLGTDLSDDHPISFIYDSSLALANGELELPSTLPQQIKLDKDNMLQCTACHNPHDNTFEKFLVTSTQYSGLCTACHSRTGWNLSSHSVSSAPWNGQGTNPWPDTTYTTVAQNGCNNCHTSHSAGGKERLLHYAFEEDNCLTCHNSNVASKNIETQLTKQYTHPVQNFTNDHDAAESFVSGTVPDHVECVDCHNPHQADNSASPGPPLISGASKGVLGIDSNGQEITEVQNLYSVCFKCHGDNNVISAFPITRQIDQLNTRLEFAPGNPSFHPVESMGINPDVPSLLPGYTKNSIISCTDCHNNDEATGPKGPHGSSYKFLLERNYNTNDYTTETPFEYDLCYKCHSRTSLMEDKSGFVHQEHLGHQTPCSACHDPHGISSSQGNITNNSHLINFDITIVQPSNQGLRYFEDQGRFKGTCFLKCHGKDHNGWGYDEFNHWEN
ncbi:MAG: hypothetical protein PF503_10390 [Desulfobacula sp.]|jgi:predicted CXXCH cytochrome family protein|nr:hypothetical protein [Desulfobacula sp.]